MENWVQHNINRKPAYWQEWAIIVILSSGVYQQILLRDCNIYKTQLPEFWLVHLHVITLPQCSSNFIGSRFNHVLNLNSDFNL